MVEALRGEVWLIDLDPVRGHEQKGTRPCLVISQDLFNRSPAGLLIVLPITSRDKGIRSHVRLVPPEGGVATVSFIKCEDVRSIISERLVRRLGKLSNSTLDAVAERLRILMGL